MNQTGYQCYFCLGFLLALKLISSVSYFDLLNLTRCLFAVQSVAYNPS